MNKSLPKISGLIIAFNEEKNIREVIANLNFCEEVIIIDSFSTDKTVEIANTFENVKIFQNKFEDFTKQRNLALKKAKNDWVLFLDGDERITAELKIEICAELGKADKKDAYYFYRKFFFAGKSLNFSGTQNDKNFRLFRKSKCHYIKDKKVHEMLNVEGTVGSLKCKLLHYSVESYKSYQLKMIHYGKLKGEELFDKGKRFNIFTQYLKTGFKFFKSYLLKFGIFDGKEGFQLTYLQSLSVFETYKSLKREENKS